MVDVFVTDEVLTDGVAAAWLLLALLGVLLVAIAVGGRPVGSAAGPADQRSGLDRSTTG